jgi:nucleoid-associated protein YgaU
MRASIARTGAEAQLNGVDVDVILDAAADLDIRDVSMHAEHGRLVISGKATYQLNREQFFEACKELDGWESDVVIEIEVDRHDVRGYHAVRAGETLASIAQLHLGRASREMDIFEANRDRMNDPDQILPGQQLLIPWR